MRWAAAEGYPVPIVHDADGPDLVMERLEGRTLRAEIAARPWTLWSAGALLADLHERLHALDASSLLDAGTVVRRAGEGTRLVHLDLHPENVILAPDGPVVIDWANAAIGDGNFDVAYVWMVLSIVTLDGAGVQRVVNSVGRRVLRTSFLRRFDRATCARALVRLVRDGAVSLRNFDATEMARLDAMVRALGLDADAPAPEGPIQQ